MFEVGQKIKIKSFDTIKQTFDVRNNFLDYGSLGVLKGTLMHFTNEMQKFCGKVYTIKMVLDDGKLNPMTDRVRLDGNNWAWHFSWIEPLNIDNRSVENV